jgi:hypothetical protein
MTFLKRNKHCKRGKSNIIMKYWGSNGYKNKDFLKKVILTQKLMEWKYYFYIYLQRWVKKDDSQKYNQRLC